MKKAIKYSVLVCLLSWTIVALAVFVFGMDKSANPVGYTLLATGYMFLPLITALILQAIDKEKFNKIGLVNFKVRWSWLIAWLLPIVLVLLCIVINGLMPGVELKYNAEQLISQYHIPEEQQEMVRLQFSQMPAMVMVLSTLFSALLAGATVNALAAFGEEYGWRHYLVEALGNLKFWKAVLFIGFVWGIWHFPLILMGHNYPNEPVWGVLLMLVVCILLCSIELYFVLKTKSVVVAAIIHGTFNACSGMVIYFINGGNDFINGMTGLSGFIVMGIAILTLWLYDKFVSKESIFSNTLNESLDR